MSFYDTCDGPEDLLRFLASATAKQLADLAEEIAYHRKYDDPCSLLWEYEELIRQLAKCRGGGSHD